MSKELITIPEFLLKFSISRTSFYREVGEGRLSIIKRGRRTLVSYEEAMRWMRNLPSAEKQIKLGGQHASR